MVNYLQEILTYRAGISQENKRFSHDSYPKAAEWETCIPTQMNQSVLISKYVADRCGLKCQVIKQFIIHVMLNNTLFLPTAYDDVI